MNLGLSVASLGAINLTLNLQARGVFAISVCSAVALLLHANKVGDSRQKIGQHGLNTKKKPYSRDMELVRSYQYSIGSKNVLRRRRSPHLYTSKDTPVTKQPQTPNRLPNSEVAYTIGPNCTYFRSYFQDKDIILMNLGTILGIYMVMSGEVY